MEEIIFHSKKTFLQSQLCREVGVCSWAQQSGPWSEEEGFTQNKLCPQLGLHKEVGAGGGDPVAKIQCHCSGLSA